MAADRTLALSRFVVVAIALPAVITTVAVVVQIVALPLLRDPVAVHWNAHGAERVRGGPAHLVGARPGRALRRDGRTHGLAGPRGRSRRGRCRGYRGVVPAAPRAPARAADAGG